MTAATAVRSRPSLGSGGFTLLELLVALAMLVILTGALYGTFFSLTRGRDAAVTGMENRRELRTTLDQLRRELSGSLYQRNNKRLGFIVQDRDFFGKPASILEFVTAAPPRGDEQRVSDQVYVRYKPLAKETANGTWMDLGKESHDLYQTVDLPPYPQMERLEGFLVECWDGAKWVKSWDTKINMRLPAAVRVTIQIKERDKTVEYAAIGIPRVTGN